MPADYDLVNRQLVADIQAGKDVTNNMERLYKRNKPLIARFVRPFTPFAEEADLLQEAYFGLYEAVFRFDASHNAKFMNFARRAIQGAAEDYCWRTGALIRTPDNLIDASRKLRKAASAFQSKNGRQPSDTELSTVTGISLHTIGRVKQAEQIRQTASLDTPLSTSEGESEETLGDFIADPSDIERDVTQEVMASKARRILWGLVQQECSERQGQALWLVYGEGLNETQAGEKLGITRQGIQNLIYWGLQHLRRRAATITRELDVEQTMLYRTGLTNFRESGASSVEKIVMRRLDKIEKIS